MNKIIEVKSCNNCPFFIDDDYGTYCNEDSSNVSPYDAGRAKINKTIPELCPLKVSTITIKLNEKQFNRSYKL